MLKQADLLKRAYIDCYKANKPKSVISFQYVAAELYNWRENAISWSGGTGSRRIAVVF